MWKVRSLVLSAQLDLMWSCEDSAGFQWSFLEGQTGQGLRLLEHIRVSWVEFTVQTADMSFPLSSWSKSSVALLGSGY